MTAEMIQHSEMITGKMALKKEKINSINEQDGMIVTNLS